VTLRTALLAGLATLSACASSNSENRVNIREDGHDVVEGNASLMRDLILDDVRTRRVDNEFLEFQATLSNATDSDLRFQWLVEWYDRQGFKLHDPAETWHHAILNGKGELALRRVSPTANADRAKVRVMPVDYVQ
jgi:uncharacterized protein YcfL